MSKRSSLKGLAQLNVNLSAARLSGELLKTNGLNHIRVTHSYIAATLAPPVHALHAAFSRSHGVHVYGMFSQHTYSRPFAHCVSSAPGILEHAVVG